MATCESSLHDVSCGLVDMPHEVVWRVVGALLSRDAVSGVNDAASLAATCRTMAAVVVDDDAMWRVLVRRDFGSDWADLHTMPAAFGVRWMRVYARVSRTATYAINEAATGHNGGTPAYKLSCEGLLVSGDVVCGRLAMGRLNGYGVVCAAQHDTGRSPDVADPLGVPAVFMEGHFKDDLLDGRGILRRGRWPLEGARRGVATALVARKLSVTCPCPSCRKHYASQAQRHTHVGCSCERATSRRKQCGRHRFGNGDCTCDAHGREPCAPCIERMHVGAVARFLSHLESFDGQWARGAPHGHAIARFECGTTYEGPWSRGLPHGRGLVNGAHHRQWFHGVLLPRCRLAYGWSTTGASPTPVVYEGDIKPRGLTLATAFVRASPTAFADGSDRERSGDHYVYREYARHGRGRMHYATGSVFEGEWADDVRCRGTLTHPDSVVVDGVWLVDGGSGTIRWPDGQCDPCAAWDASGRPRAGPHRTLAKEPPL
ncbi:Morn repeat incomplete domain containing protein [Pandoravirus salinus]|uniref:Morn repeat incomplete domain containing protein n=1 Tax=Pandoravirus salinus TaxID=1349410 RepID=S4VTM6_9VIRU|nr:morn repeat incomplete domain [Pandoravirus salinus]AGO83673.1 Morn repeat incomplete domain containing protein [Pandoravirus salinus]